MVAQPSWMAHNVYKKGGGASSVHGQAWMPMYQALRSRLSPKEETLLSSALARIGLFSPYFGLIELYKLPRDVTDSGASFIVARSHY